MKSKTLLLSIIRIEMNYSTLWIVHEIRVNCEMVNHSFIHECEYVAYVKPLLEECESYAYRSFDIRNSSIHDFDGNRYCGFNSSFDKPAIPDVFIK